MTAGPWRSLARRVQSTLEVEFGQLRPQLVALSVLASPLPTGSFASLRAQVLRLVGFRLGPGTLVHGLPQVTGGGADLGANLVVGAGCVLERGCVLELGERITLGDRVTVAAEAMILTTTHELGPRERRAGPLRSRPVVVGTGVTIGTRAIVLPGVTIGEGAEVLAGSVVTKDVPPRTRWGGVPARLLGPVES
jgi:acetyltransferase-like isoleucine patch superfamily enzyme